MPRDGRTTALAHPVAFSVATVLLVWAGTSVPLFGFWALLVCPVPMAILGRRHGERSMVFGTILSTAAVGLILSPPLAAYFFLGYMPISWAFVLVAKEERTGGESFLVCAIASLGAKLLLLAVFWVLTGRNVLLPDIGQVELMLRELYAGLPQPQAGQDAAHQIAVLLPRMMPSLLLLMSALDALIGYELCWLLLRRTDRPIPALPPLAEWRFPRSLLLALLASFVMGWIWDADTWMEGAVFAVNLRLVLSVLFFLQGTSMVLWWMLRRHARLLTWIVAAVVMIFPLTWIWLDILGVADMVLDFRARARR